MALAKQRPKRSVDQIHTCVDLQSEKARLYLSMPPPKDGAHGCCCCQWLHFLENMQQHLRDFAEVPLRLSESDSCELPENGYRFADSHHRAATHKEAAGLGYRPKERRRASVKRNSFIEMAKLHDLLRRITYISSHARQEHLYEVYATEPDRAFWRELVKCNQEEFEKSGTNGKCIKARELVIALLESFINYDHDYLLKK